MLKELDYWILYIVTKSVSKCQETLKEESTYGAWNVTQIRTLSYPNNKWSKENCIKLDSRPFDGRWWVKYGTNDDLCSLSKSHCVHIWFIHADNQIESYSSNRFGNLAWRNFRLDKIDSRIYRCFCMIH